MDRNLANLLTNLVQNNNEPLKEYAKWRIEQLRNSLEATKSLEDLMIIKGRIAEARRLLTLYEEVQKARKE